jgi:hypothetical protein
MTRAGPPGKFSLLALSSMLSGRPGMTAPSQADGEPPDTSHSPGAGVLDAERAHLLRSREFLRLMREDDPDYSMALLLQDTINAGVPPSLARLPMTPEEVAKSYEGTS